MVSYAHSTHLTIQAGLTPCGGAQCTVLLLNQRGDFLSAFAAAKSMQLHRTKNRQMVATESGKGMKVKVAKWC